MRCHEHYDREAVASCDQCGHPLCEDCRMPLADGGFCRTCLAGAMGEPAGADPRSDRPSPVLACVLSLVPGLGLVYLGRLADAMILWLGLVVVLAARAEPLIVLYWAALIPASMVYTWRLAARARGEGGRFAMGNGSPPMVGRRRQVVAGGLLVLVGFLFLLENLDVNLAWLEDLWPLALVGVGGVLLWRGLRPRDDQGPGSSTKA